VPPVHRVTARYRGGERSLPASAVRGKPLSAVEARGAPLSESRPTCSPVAVHYHSAQRAARTRVVLVLFVSLFNPICYRFLFIFIIIIVTIIVVVDIYSVVPTVSNPFPEPPNPHAPTGLCCVLFRVYGLFLFSPVRRSVFATGKP